MIYLLHFQTPYKHARHYMGMTGRISLVARLEEHITGRGARLMDVVTGLGIDFVVARTWDGNRSYERQLKKQGGHSRHCPVCRRLAETAAT